jgi:hypothetical protein
VISCTLTFIGEEIIITLKYVVFDLVQARPVKLRANIKQSKSQDNLFQDVLINLD